MKTKPTETDREAGRVFVPLAAMRVMWSATSKRWDRVADGTAHTGHPFAIDTDDPATVGCMLAQVEAAAGETVDLWTHSRHTEVEYEVDRYDGATLGSGPTRGAALVAAMRAFAGAAR